LTNITNMTLKPGNNSFAVTGSIDQTPILKALSQKPYCENGGLLPLQLIGNTVVDNGQSIPWLSGALAAKNLTVTVEIGEAVKKLVGTSIPCAA
jgi:hypothetical protein